MVACTGAPGVGAYGKLLIEPGDSPHTFDSSSERYEILPFRDAAEDLQKHGRLIGGQGITGLLYPLSTRTRDGGEYVYGRFSLNPSPGYLSTLLPYLVGDHAGDGIYNPNNCPNTFGALVHLDHTTKELKDGMVNRWFLYARAPEFREQGAPDLFVLTMECYFKSDATGTSWPGTEPDFPEGESYYPYAFHDLDNSINGSVLINSAQRKPLSLLMTYDNQLKLLYANSLTAHSIYSTGRKVTLDATFPYDSTHENLFDMSYVGAAATIKMGYLIGSNTYDTTFEITNFKAPPESPFIKDKNEVYFRVQGQAYGDASTKELVVTNDTSATTSSVSSTPSATVSNTPSATPSATPSNTPS